jgi:indole-3-glycerol phosphate synthase
MADYLDKLAATALQTIQTGYYENPPRGPKSPQSLRQAILDCPKTPIISEIKFASPSQGAIREQRDVKQIAQAMIQGGATGISVLTEPHHFHGQLQFITLVRNHTDIPLLMKDFILDPLQITAAEQTGASAILLIQALFDRDYATAPLDQMIEHAHKADLEVLLETHSTPEFLTACHTKADMIGINNRDLRTLGVDIRLTTQILAKHCPVDRVIVSESGIKSPSDLTTLRAHGAHAFLIGTSIMKAPNLTERIKEFVETQ